MSSTSMSVLPADLRADDLRASTDTMRDAVRRVALGGEKVWVGPFTALVDELREIGRVDLCLGRLVEGHADACRILDQAGVGSRDGVYGVWASRSVGTGVAAVPVDDGWHLTGEMRFASGIDIVDRVLMPGWLDDTTHLLFDLSTAGVQPDRSTWHTSAMDASRSFTVRVDATCSPADVVGPAGFYLDRPGFPVGGLEVAALWAGGAQSVLEQVVEGLRRFRASPHQIRRLGVMEQAVWQARTIVEATAQRLPGLAGDTLVRETSCARTSVVTACEQVVDEATRVVGPAGLSGNGRLARTLADLTIFVRQHHLDLTLEALGRHALAVRDTVG